MRYHNMSVTNQIFTTTSYDSRNKITAKLSPTTLQDSDPIDSLWPHIIKQYNFIQNFSGLSTISIALHELYTNHFITKDLIIELVNQSPTAPHFQKKSIAKSIYSGFTRDMNTFAYTGIPLFESILRHIFLNNGGTILRQASSDGTQSEITLKTLLLSEEVTDFLGKAIATDLMALLEDSNGYKLRHNVAHGLMNDNQINSSVVNYAFLAFCFLIFRPLQIIHERDSA